MFCDRRRHALPILLISRAVHDLDRCDHVNRHRPSSRLVRHIVSESRSKEAPMLRFALAFVTALTVTVPALAQIDQIKAKLDAEGHVELHSSGLVIEKADYRHEGKAVEAVLVHAAAGGASPAVFVVP